MQHDDYVEASSPTRDVYDSKLDAVANNRDNDQLQSSKSDASRENLLLGIFQENTHQKIRNSTKEINENVSHISRDMHHSQSFKRDTMSNLPQHKEHKDKKSGNKVGPSREVKLVRIFPGPAGLISPLKNNDTSIASYLDNAKESENKTATECIGTNFSKSQDEKNLFGEKAWRFLLNDLPNNFFKKHSISVIKSRANASHCNSMKVKFIAGVLDYIDHSHEDPSVILKDSTGSIEGIIHRDIPLSYPSVLEPNVVVLLHNVGLLKTTTYIVMNKYHILVSRANLLAVYSNKGRIVHTSSMEDILSSTSNIELTRDCIASVSKHCAVSGDFDEQKILNDNCDNTVSWAVSSSVSTSIDDSKRVSVNNPLLCRSSDEHEKRRQTFEKNSKERKTTDEIFESLEHPVDVDMSDIFFTTDNDFDLVLDEQKCLNSSSGIIAQTSEIQQCELQTRNISCRDNMGKESVLVNLENKLQERNLQRSVVDTAKTSDIPSKCNKTVAAQSVYSHKNFLPSNDNAPKMSNLKSASLISKCNTENSRNLASYFTGETLREYDSDDEILSQLDVDSVSNDHKKEY